MSRAREVLEILEALTPKEALAEAVSKKTKYRDFTLEYEKSYVHEIVAYKDGEYAGSLQVVDDATGYEGKWYVMLAEVEKEHRRKGLATFMYDWMEKILKAPLVGSLDQSPDAIALWRSRMKKR